MSNVLRSIPSVSELLESPPLKSLVQRVNRNVVVTGIRQFLDDMRVQVQSAAATAPADLAQRIADWIATDQKSAIRPVVNATGIVLHPRLGNAPLADEAIDAIAVTARGYANVELDLKTGEACQRLQAVEGLLVKLTGAEAATVVNTHAAAVWLALMALARGREIVVSRGQLIEIEHSFRLPEIIAASGAALREVGTINITRVADYAAAITPQTAALVRVHASNCEMTGDCEHVALAELVALARKHDLPLIDDIGSGGLLDFSRYGVTGEPIAGASIRAGADLVFFSGDKLLGGPQCGVIAGRRSLIQTISSHPLMRPLEIDKFTLAALAATLQLYQDLELAERAVPVVSLLATSLENLRQRAERLAPQLAAAGVAAVEVVACLSHVLGTSLATQTVPSVCLGLTPTSRTVEQLAAALRSGNSPVVGRLHDGKLFLDLRSVQPRDDIQLVAAVEALKPKTNNSQPQNTTVGPAID
jgi:L-seryl-tRNA(Ser) seleniumtransferase